jgi:hypothetical protein
MARSLYLSEDAMVVDFEERFRELYDGFRLVVMLVPGGFSMACGLLLIIWLRLLLRVFEDMLESSRTDRRTVDGVSTALPQAASSTGMSPERCPRLSRTISGEGNSDCS